jgi:uncharacterized protein
MPPQTLNPILLTLRQYLQTLYGEQLIELILFGSQARQDAQPDSDIDVLIVLDRTVDPWPENKRTATFISQLCLDHSILITPIFTSSTQYHTKATALLRNIDREGIPI